ncbi:MAG: DUF4836 family protein, partial [Bacteroidaceae bacterium]|nr:DUF4836 family protein [Bacteroidaceae bacterium]
MKNFRLTAVMVCVLFALASCHKTDYIQVVPKEASVVVSANMANIASEGDIANSAFMTMVNRYLGLIAAGEARDQIRHYFQNPADMGIDFTCPLYFFKAGSFVGVTMRVADDDDAGKFIQMLVSQGLCHPAAESDNVKQALLLDDIFIAYNSHTMLMMADLSGGNVSQTRQIAVGLMEQEKNYSFVTTEAFSQMEKRNDCDVVAYSNGTALSGDLLASVKSFIPKGIRLVDIEIFSSMSFQKGRAVLTADINGKSNAARKLLEDGNKNFRKIE